MTEQPERRELLEPPISLAVFLSAGLHVALAGILLFLAPYLGDGRRPEPPEAITVQLLGALAPPAPAAPKAPVDPNLKGPDVAEAPSSPVTPQPAPPAPPAPLAAPAEVIPLGPKAPEKPPVPPKPPAPPKAVPPKVQPEAPPKPKAPNNDAAIERKMAELKRKVEADELDAAIESSLYNIAKTRGAGQGESSEESGGASSGQRLHPEKEAYYRQVKAIVAANWRPPAGGSVAGRVAVFVIRIEPNGQFEILASTYSRASGDPDYDLSVERAIRQSVLPPLPPIFGGRADTPALRFGADEMLRR